MNDEAAFTRAMQERPDDNALRLIFADWLEEQGDPRGELIRLLNTLTQSVEVPQRNRLENRLRSLVAAGVKPVGPFWTNSIGMRFAWIPAGTFLMGSPETEEGREKYETQHEVRLTKGLWVAVHLLTQASWREVMENNPSHHQGDNLPVEQVSWEDCQQFLVKLSERDGHAYRLPTEAEWEYGCRAGTTTPFFVGKTISKDQANFENHHYGDEKKDVYRGETTSVGRFIANGFGLHDMHGNLYEWCSDWHAEYSANEAVDPQGPQKGECRVVRGGSCYFEARLVRSAYRARYEPAGRSDYVGVRVAMTFTP